MDRISSRFIFSNLFNLVFLTVIMKKSDSDQDIVINGFHLV